MFTKQVVMIGARKTMVGMMTQPVDYEPGERPVVVILNSGIIHRVGHHRIWTWSSLACSLGPDIKY